MLERKGRQEIAGWPAERLVATYNSLPGVKPVKALKDPKTAASKIWEPSAQQLRFVDHQLAFPFLVPVHPAKRTAKRVLLLACCYQEGSEPPVGKGFAWPLYLCSFQ